jgi:hypothetical protein
MSMAPPPMNFRNARRLSSDVEWLLMNPPGCDERSGVSTGSCRPVNRLPYLKREGSRRGPHRASATDW